MSRLANEAKNVTLEQARKIGKGIRVLERKGDVFSFFRQITLPSCHVCKWPLFNSVISVLLPQDLGCINGINIAINVVLECAMKREMQSRSQKKPRAWKNTVVKVVSLFSFFILILQGFGIMCSKPNFCNNERTRKPSC